MKPEVKVFTRDNPCTKLDVWNCFRGSRGFRRVQVDEAHSIVGLNAPRNMLKNGYITIVEHRQSEYYALTASGVKWLSSRFKKYLERHPNDRKRAKNVPKSF